jgi:asparagine synthase (glutamine-hydrolysing)
MGFSIPSDQWLRGPLREWAEAKLDPARIARHDVFDPVEVRHLWDEHLSGYSNNTATLWPVLMFDGWMAAIHDVDGDGADGASTVAERLKRGTDVASR